LSVWLRGLLKYLDQLSLFSIILWPVIIGAGVLASRLTSLSWLLLPPFNLLAVGLPILWILSIGRRSLASGSPLRHWASFSVGVVLTPVLSFILEALLLAGVGVLAVILLAQNPSAAAEANRLVQRIINSNGDTETITRSLRPILSNPAVLFAGLAMMSGLIPMIEELLKPLPAWLLGRRLQTPAEGFVAGLLGGAGYALAESLGASGAFDSNQWLGVVIGRAGTDLLHILTSGLMGLALYYAFQKGKYLRLVLTYLLVIVIHGSWNFFSLWAGIYPFIIPTAPALTAASRMPAFISPIGLAVLVLIMLTLLIWRNTSLRRSAVPPLAVAGGIGSLSERLPGQILTREESEQSAWQMTYKDIQSAGDSTDLASTSGTTLANSEIEPNGEMPADEKDPGDQAGSSSDINSQP
jgi:hypothetical protein